MNPIRMLTSLALLAGSAVAQGAAPASTPAIELTAPPLVVQGLRRPWDGDGAARVTLRLRNRSEADLSGITLRATPAVEVRSAGDVLRGAVLTSIDAKGCGGEPVTLKAGAACDVGLRFTGALRPGEYRADVAATAGSATERATVRVRAGLSWFWALLPLVAGALLGGFIASWRDGGRDAARAFEAGLALDERFVALAAEAEQRGAAAGDLARLRAMISQHLDALYAGDAGDATIPARVGHLDRWVQLAQHAAGLPDAARRALDPSFAIALGDIAAADHAAASAAMSTLAGAVADALAAQAPAVGAAAAAIQLPYAPAFSRSIGLAALRRRIRGLDRLTMAALLALFAPIALFGIWSEDSWGSLGDFVFAFGVGAGAFGSVAATVSAFRTAAQPSV